MVLSSLPISLALFGASTATVLPPISGRAMVNRAPDSNAPQYAGYAFLYFTGSDEQIYLAASNGNDALSFNELNGGQPILSSTEGDGGIRDPYIFRSQEGDKFFILGTDLCIGCGTSWEESQKNGSRYLEIWESTDLITFSEQRHVLVSPESYGNSWAPEAYYDTELGTYVVYWASGIYDDASNPGREDMEYQRMVYATTDDFHTFSEPQVWQDAPPEGRIDSTVLFDNDVYYRFTKATVDGCADIVQESSSSLTAELGDWSVIASCIGTTAGTEQVEGPSIFKTNPDDVNGERYILLVDEFGGDGYVPLESDDLASGEWKLNQDFDYPTTPRHGTIIPLTEEELNGVIDAWGTQ